MKTDINNKVLYFHINSVKNEIFYVGIGNTKRPYDKIGRSNFWKRTVKKYNYIIDVVETGLTWEQAKEREIFYIAKIGRRDLTKGPLVNLSDGGEGNYQTYENKVIKHNNKIKQNEEIIHKIFNALVAKGCYRNNKKFKQYYGL